MNKFKLRRATAIGFLTVAIITLTGIYIATAHAEKSGVYCQNGGAVTETSKTYTATSPDQSGVYISNSGSYTLTDSEISKIGDTSSLEDSDFYGLNAGALAEGGSTITMSGWFGYHRC
jgi:hypothetical protein